MILTFSLQVKLFPTSYNRKTCYITEIYYNIHTICLVYENILSFYISEQFNVLRCDFFILPEDFVL